MFTLSKDEISLNGCTLNERILYYYTYPRYFIKVLWKSIKKKWLF